MKLWNRKSECCGCTACLNVCPKKCITMENDIEGFAYPVIEENNCINCGKCVSVCPIKNPNERNNKAAYIVRNNDASILQNSSSGGFFSAVANEVLKIGGLVCGVVFDTNFDIIHILSNKNEDVAYMRGSKYVQSSLGFTFTKLKSKLEEGKYVLFVGTPCQVEGLRNFLKKPYPNLFCVDFVCHGVSSPMVWKHYISELEKRFNSKLTYYTFRSKHSGHHNFGTYASFENGTRYLLDDKTQEKDFMHLAYFNEICSRPSCHSCAFKTIKRSSDITMFDCWHPKELGNIIDDDLGYSTVIINTDSGNTMFDRIRENLFVREISLEKSIELDGGNAIFSMIPNSKREAFLNDVSTKISLESLAKTYFVEKNSLGVNLRKFFVNILKKTHIFTAARKLYYSVRGKITLRRM